MRSAILVGALAGLAVATPLAKRQEIEFDQFDAQVGTVDLSTPPVDPSADHGSYDAAAAVAVAADSPVTSDALTKRATTDCKAETTGYGPVSSPDNADTFSSDPQFVTIATNAATPQGYELSFSALNAATRSDTYITYKTLKSYDTIACQQFCDKTDSCYFFNIFLERDPKITPAAACTNPGSTTLYKCSLFGAKQTAVTADNDGQWREQFHVVIAGSNGYNKLAAPPAQTNFTGPVEFGGAIQSPDASYFGYKYFAGAFNPAQCAASCQSTTAYNKKHPRSDGTYDTCSFFNAYVLSKNNVPQGTYCSMYTKTWGKSYSTNYGQYRGSDYYSVSQSYGYSLTAPADNQ